MYEINRSVAIYQEQIEKGEIKRAYEFLLKYLMQLNAHFSKKFGNRFSFGNVSPGYMDFTYFPFFNDYLRKRKLRFGVVLNHHKMRFELWLMGQNASVQRHYWAALKHSEWNAGRQEMPKYSVLETVLLEQPDFEKISTLTEQIEKKTLPTINKIIEHLQVLEKNNGA